MAGHTALTSARQAARIVTAAMLPSAPRTMVPRIVDLSHSAISCIVFTQKTHNVMGERRVIASFSTQWFGIRCAIGGMTSRLFSNDGNGLVHFSVSPDPHKARHDSSRKARDSNSQKLWLPREMDDRHSRDEESYRRSEVSQKRLFVG